MKFTPRLPPEGINTTTEHPLKEFAYLLAGIGAFIALAIIILAASVDVLVRFIPPSAEAKLFSGTTFMAAEKPRDEVAQRTQDYLTHLIAQLNRSAEQPLPVSVTVINSKQPNAFVIPGGRIFVTAGLLQLLDTENGLSMVLAHEWAHQHLRHPLRGLGLGVIVTAVLAIITGTQDNAWISDLLGGAAQVSMLVFSREQEHAADEIGLDLTTRVYGHSAGADEFFVKILAQQSDFDSNVPDFLSSHPATEERIARIQAHSANSQQLVTPLPDYVKDYAATLIAARQNKGVR